MTAGATTDVQEAARWLRSRSASTSRGVVPTGSTTSPSCPAAAPATPRTSTSRGRSTPSGSTCRSWRPPWTAWSAPSTAIEIGRLGGMAVLNLEGLWTRYEDPEPLFEEIATPRRRQGHGPDAADVPRAHQARARHRAHPRDQVGRRGVVRVGDTAAHHRARPRHPRRRARHARHPGHGGVGRARVEDRRAAQPEEVHPCLRPSRDRRRVRVVPGGPAPHAHRRGGRARRRGPGQRLHHAGASSGWACPRPPPSPMWPGPACAISTRPVSTSTSSRTAG